MKGIPAIVTPHMQAHRDRLVAQGKHEAASALLDVSVIASEQIEEAKENLHRDPSASIRFPYPSLHAIVGKVAPGRLVFVMANTGQGKTTFMLDVLDRWAVDGVRIDYLGTEQQPDELLTKWACLRTDVPPHVAINVEWDEWQQGEQWRTQVEEELDRIHYAHAEQIVFHPDKFITLAKIEAAAADAALRGAQVLIVDHIDRVETGATDNEYMALKRIIRRLKELARDHSLVMLVASQINRKGREGDRLAAYRPPQLHHMQGGATKEQEADAVLGLWRPIRQRRGDEPSKQFKELLSAAARGDVEQREVLDDNVMAIVCLKHRTGNREGMRTKLTVRHGRLSEILERDRYETRAGYPRKVV